MAKVDIEQVRKEIAAQGGIKKPQYSKEENLIWIQEQIEDIISSTPFDVPVEIRDSYEEWELAEMAKLELPAELKNLDEGLMVPAGAVLHPEMDPVDHYHVRFYLPSILKLFEMNGGSRLTFRLTLYFIIDHEFRHTRQIDFMSEHGIDIKAAFKSEAEDYEYSKGPMETDANEYASGKINDLGLIFSKWLAA